MKERALKVQAKTIMNTFREAVTHPEIRLAGEWLRVAGFDPGTRIRVEVSENSLIIEKDDCPTH